MNADSNLRVVDDHYQTPVSNVTNLVPPTTTIQVDQPVPSAPPPPADMVALSSSPQRVQVGHVVVLWVINSTRKMSICSPSKHNP